jgi:serine/threonine-protein kinase
MKPAEVKRVLDIVEDALELTGVELDEYLERVCGEDSLLRREVLDYLHYDSNLSIFHGPAADFAPPPPLADNSGFRYEFREEIARGGMGVVVRAVDTELRREVAVKILHDSLHENLGFIRRFVQEAQIGGQLQHPGIAPLYDIGRLPDGRPFIAMKLVRGETLQADLHSRQDGHEDQARLLGIFEQICQAVAYAHSHGVIHRDLKPANVMIGEFGEVQIMDWGLARPISDERSRSNDSSVPEARSPAEASSAVTLSTDAADTRVGQVMGTPAYMPPEQFLGRTDTTTDVFALGSMLCEILTGQPAGRDPEFAETQLDKCDCDASLIALAKTCIARDPTDRPTDAGELATRVAAYLEATETRIQQARLTAARAETIAGEERKRRRITIGLAVSCSLAAVIAAASWGWVSNLRATHQKELDAQYDRVRNEAEVAYGQAEQFYQRAQSAPLHELGDWRVAREAVTRAESLTEAGSLGPEMRERISELSNRIAVGESERNFVFAIEAARRDGIEASKYHQIERPSLERSALISLLREHGLYPDSGQPWERAVRQLREYSEEVRDEVVGAMDQALLHAANDEKAWLTRVLQDADQNSWRRSWRRALAERNEADLLRIVRDAGLRDQSLRTALNATYSVQTLMPFEERVSKLRELRARHVNDVWINLRLGRVLAGKGRTQEATTYYQAALAAQPTASVHGVIATVANRQARYNEAVAHWTEAIRLKPNVDSYHLLLGHNLMFEFRYQEAVAAFRRAIELSGPECDYVVNLGRILSEETVSKIPEDERPGWENAWQSVDVLFTSIRRDKSGGR